MKCYKPTSDYYNENGLNNQLKTINCLYNNPKYIDAGIYENECKNPSHSCNQFCMDMANCRKLLVDICGFSKGWDGFDKETYSKIEQDIKEHAYNHRYSSTYAPFVHENYNGWNVDVCGIMQVRFE